MFNLQNAPSSLKKAAYLRGIRSGKYEIVNMQPPDPSQPMFRVHSHLGTKTAEISEVDCKIAEPYSWQEIRSGI